MPELEFCSYIGIDPGKAGGLACLSRGAVWTKPMPETDRDLWDWFPTTLRAGEKYRAVVERVHSSPQMGVASAFTFGRGYGAILMALTAAGIPFEEVLPKAWMRGMGVTRKAGWETARWKQRLRAKAQQLYPDLPLWREPRSVGRQLAVADALLIATYCKRKHEGTLG